MPFAAWFYPLQVSLEYNSEPPDLPEGIEPYRILVVEDDEVEYYMTRWDARFAAMRNLGLWDRPHPCVSALIELDALADVPLRHALEERCRATRGVDQEDRPVGVAEADRHVVEHVGQPLDWLGNESIDAAIMALVLHHLEDPVPALREVNRVLRPGGRLVVSTVHPVADWLQLGGSYFTDEMIDDTWNAGRKVRFRRAPLTAWCAEFREAGFLIERLVEPFPSESMKDRYPDTYDTLSVEPFFIALVLVKAPTSAARQVPN